MRFGLDIAQHQLSWDEIVVTYFTAGAQNEIRKSLCQSCWDVARLVEVFR